MSDAQRDAAGQLVFQCLGGRLGWNIHDMRRADGLEIYISQGAKPGPDHRRFRSMRVRTFSTSGPR
ncbi:MAG: glutamate synthase-related protein [Myxococcota bacterium]|nr:glutamate synthase-related protein [Myxococcota bacterium]